MHITKINISHQQGIAHDSQTCEPIAMAASVSTAQTNKKHIISYIKCNTHIPGL